MFAFISTMLSSLEMIDFFLVTYSTFGTKSSTLTYIAQTMKFFIEDLFSKCDQLRSFLRIWSHLLKKSLMENKCFVQC